MVARHSSTTINGKRRHAIIRRDRDTLEFDLVDKCGKNTAAHVLTFAKPSAGLAACMRQGLIAATAGAASCPMLR